MTTKTPPQWRDRGMFTLDDGGELVEDHSVGWRIVVKPQPVGDDRGSR